METPLTLSAELQRLRHDIRAEVFNSATREDMLEIVSAIVSAAEEAANAWVALQLEERLALVDDLKLWETGETVGTAPSGQSGDYETMTDFTVGTEAPAEEAGA